MNCTKLIWFAAGAATTAAATTGTKVLQPAPSKVTAYLMSQEPVDAESEEVPLDSDMIANRTGELLRDCSAKSLETTFLYNDHAPTADLPITTENSSAFACVLKEAAAREYPMNIEMRGS